MRKKGIWLLAAVLCLLLTFSMAVPAFANEGPPPTPNSFYGTVTIAGGSPAPVGTVITAKVAEVECGSITTTVEGQYGSSSPLGPWLVVQGYIDQGTTIDFYIGGAEANENGSFNSGAFTELNLTTEEPVVVLVSISALPISVNLDDVGETQAITVTATYDDASTADVTASADCTYVSGVPAVATVTSPGGGLITAVAEGSTTITVSYTEGGITKTDTVLATVGFDPMNYDLNEDGVISKTEALTSIEDYFAGDITKAQAWEVIVLYFT